MVQGLLFKTPHQLCDFVRLHASIELEGPFQLLEISSDKRSESDLILLGSQKNHSFQPAKPVQVKWVNDRILVDGVEREVSQSVIANTLIECVKLQPNQTHHYAGAVYFWVTDPKLVGDIFLKSIHLYNDRIQFGSITPNEAKRSETLVKIDRPSYFLIQTCLEDHSDQVAIYYQDATHLFIRWDWQHPLKDWWPSIESKPEKWAFFDPDNEIRMVEPIIWQDAYDLTKLSLDFNYQTVATKSSATPPQFEVPLRLIPNATNHPSPELWLLDESGLIQLEQTLQLSEQDSLKNWQVAVQQSTEHNREYTFVREILKQSDQSHHDYSGIALSRYKGINNLMLPIDYELQPPLRRDTYRDLFKLKSGFITLILPDDPEKTDPSFSILTIDENHFQPIDSFIDYLVNQDRLILDSLISQSAFDFKHYLKAPSHPNLGNTPQSDQLPGPIDHLADREISDFSSGSEPKKADPDTPKESPKDQPLTQLEQKETELEREIIDSGPSIPKWLDLHACKIQLHKYSDALLAAIEAMWLARNTTNEDKIIESILAISGQILDGVSPDSVTLQDHDWLRRSAAFATAMNHPQPSELDQWVSDTSHFVRSLEPGLRSKERWLIWARIFKLNQDERKESQLREEIRNQITEQGLSLDETPVFIRNRIFNDRKIDLSDSEKQAAWNEAKENLVAIESCANQIKNERLGFVSKAVISRIYSKIGDYESALRMVQTEENQDKCTQAWVTLFEIETLKEIDHSRSQAKLKSLEQLLKANTPDTTKAINQLQETYKKSKEADNPAAFLSQTNRERTYPKGPQSQIGKLSELNTNLLTEIKQGNEVQSVNLMHNLMTLEDKTIYNDHIKLPEVVETIVTGLSRFKWGDQGATLAGQFEQFSEQAYRYIDRPENHFYGSILHSNLALGLLTLEKIEQAETQIQLAENLAPNNSSDLDFLDAVAALVNTIEQLPIPLRRQRLMNLVGKFRDRFDTTKPNPYLVNERLFAILVQLMDQITEAAVSRDRLSLQQFQNYQLQDEFIILQRIQSESFINQ